MKKCIRCETPMIENLIISATGSAYQICVKKSRLSGSLGDMQAAVCPECGYIETYIEDPSAIKKIVTKQKNNT